MTQMEQKGKFNDGLQLGSSKVQYRTNVSHSETLPAS